MSVNAPNQRDPASAARRKPAAWMQVHLANMAWWAAIYLGSFALVTALAGMADLLRADAAETAERIDSVCRLFQGWLTWGPPALAVYAAGGWIFARKAAPSGPALRSHPVYLAWAFAFRRLANRRLRPARGTYWRHRFIRHRWLLLLIKIYFLPIAAGSLAGTITNLSRMIQRAGEEPPLLLVLGFLIVLIKISIDATDAVVSSIAYAVESRRPGGSVKAVDTNWLGWLSCMICYPLGWLLTSSLLAKRIDEESQLFALESAPGYVCAVCGVLCYAVYGFTALNLGLRYANLSYRGTTDWGLFRWVRHPQYTSKIGGWFFEWLPYFAVFSNILTYLAWAAIYVTRIVTEERFLGRFPEYQEYRKKVRWRCVPGVW